MDEFETYEDVIDAYNSGVAVVPGAVSYTHLTLPTNREV